jgi:2-polyprenyl-3-methyl-5-hydroxy-6-metoxy-1,4-benzoquinol methylase
MAIHYRSHRDPRSSHQQIQNIVRNLGQSPVLDVGAAQGMLGASLAGTGIVLDAVEANPEWAELARPHYRSVFPTIIEKAPLPQREYKVVVCADVLEHTANPLAVIAQLRAAATEDATFIISVPNIAHLAVRLMLLFGRFPKMERGPLDRTHLHFFTKDTARDLLAQGGLRVARFSVTGVPLDEIWKNGEGKMLYRTMMRSQHVALAIAPRLFGFQWIMVAKAEAAPSSEGPVRSPA